MRLLSPVGRRGIDRVNKWRLINYSVILFILLASPGSCRDTATAKVHYCGPCERWRPATTLGTSSPTLLEQCVGSLTSRRVVNTEELQDGAYGLLSLSDKTRESNDLQMQSQRQHFVQSYLTSVGPARVRTPDLLHGGATLKQMSKLIGDSFVSMLIIFISLT